MELVESLYPFLYVFCYSARFKQQPRFAVGRPTYKSTPETISGQKSKNFPGLGGGGHGPRLGVLRAL